MSMDNKEAGPGSLMTPRLIVGVAIALFGVVLVLDRLNLVIADQALRWWPAVIVAIGRADLQAVPPGRWRHQRRHRHDHRRLAAAEHDRHRAGALLGDVLAAGPDWHRHRARAAGARTPHRRRLARTPTPRWHLRRARRREAHRDAERFRGGEITAFMGGAQIDLRQASDSSRRRGRASISSSSWVAGEIVVPPSWTVETPLVPVMGGVDDKRLPPLPGSPRASAAGRRRAWCCAGCS